MERQFIDYIPVRKYIFCRNLPQVLSINSSGCHVSELATELWHMNDECIAACITLRTAKRSDLNQA